MCVFRDAAIGKRHDRARALFADLTHLHLAREILRWGWSVGAHTYGCPRVLEPDLVRLEIGRFCSIGPNVTIALGNHRTDIGEKA